MKKLNKLCCYFDKINLLEYQISKNIQLSTNVLYYMLSSNNINFISFMLSRKCNFDVVDEKGLSPIEYVLFMLHNGATNMHNMICLLHTLKYSRNPKWVDFVLNTNVYVVQKYNEYESNLYTSLQTIKNKNILKINICNVTNYIKYG